VCSTWVVVGVFFLLVVVVLPFTDHISWADKYSPKYIDQMVGAEKARQIRDWLNTWSSPHPAVSCPLLPPYIPII